MDLLPQKNAHWNITENYKRTTLRQLKYAWRPTPLVPLYSRYQIWIMKKQKTIGNQRMLKRYRFTRPAVISIRWCWLSKITVRRCILVIAHSEMTCTSTIYFSLAIETHRASRCLLQFQNPNSEKLWNIKPKDCISFFQVPSGVNPEMHPQIYTEHFGPAETCLTVWIQHMVIYFLFFFENHMVTFSIVNIYIW